MKKLSSYLFVIVTAASIAALAGVQSTSAKGITVPLADPSPIPDSGPISQKILECHFDREGVKGGDETECRATVTFEGKFYNLKVSCDDDTIYNAIALLQAVQVSSKIGTSVISALKPPADPTFPSVWVDGDIQNITAFENRDAHLRLDHDELIRGSCDHQASPVR